MRPSGRIQTILRGQIVGVTLLPFLGLGAIELLEIGVDNNKNVY